MIGSIIGGAMKVGGSIFGGMSAAKAVRKQRDLIEKRKRENQAWYERKINEDPTQRADAQRVLNMTEDKIRQRNREASGTSAVTGGTEESTAALKAANSQALADAASRIAVAGEARKDGIEERYLDRNAAYEQQLQNLELNRSREIAKAVTGIAGAAGDIADSFGNDGNSGGNGDSLSVKRGNPGNGKEDNPLLKYFDM